MRDEICWRITPSGLAAGGHFTTLARESIKLSFRSDFSARGKAHLRQTARYLLAFHISHFARYYSLYFNLSQYSYSVSYKT